jgi:hypothetical protein
MDIQFFIQKYPHVSGRSPLMTFMGPLMMYSNFSVTVYGALGHVHIFSDFRLVNVY